MHCVYCFLGGCFFTTVMFSAIGLVRELIDIRKRRVADKLEARFSPYRTEPLSILGDGENDFGAFV